MQAKKSLGQNFLRDEKILEKIANFAQIKKTNTVVEIGPGEGTLTKFILARAKKVIAIEKDERMVEFLKEKFSEKIKDGKLEIIKEDILDFDLVNSKFFTKYILIGNIPYYITGALFKKFLETENQPGSITFVVQREVAERIIAKDNKESILSISIKAYGEPFIGGIIKSGSFYPRPKIDSAILSVKNISKEKLAGITEKYFFEILKSGFAHKRKLLIRNLGEMSRLNLDIEPEKLKKIFEICDLSTKTRAEDLSVNDWVNLTKNLKRFSPIEK